MTSNISGPIGLKWDSKNYSCSYDSLLVILYDIWKENPDEWTENFESINEIYMKNLASGFKHVYEGSKSLENIRNDLRQDLNSISSKKFPMGKNNASVAELAFELLKSKDENAISQIFCNHCDYTGIEYSDHLEYVFDIEKHRVSSTEKWGKKLKGSTSAKCNNCLNKLSHVLQYKESPKLVILEYPFSNIETSHKIKIKGDNQMNILSLRGIVYHGENHFSSRIISLEGKIWYHDGIETGKKSIEDGYLFSIESKALKTCQEKNLVLAVYA
ncbi:hypothetical protein GALMADRAFT_1362017 [Galerina marginata CBS 339.88]|uniref:USP domain-containing protein n=1 Tax=Galerina marginata (strain CBS 339.88) TaxID=685588 RepID=A0A067TDU4_GALM3|nr:hypothetical protein GALMADRAFT_1362017 [Galerina marginata CBS 339.88]